MNGESPETNRGSLSSAKAPSWIRRWARLLDSAVRIPLTRVTFGIDVVLGLVPVVGDFAGLACGLPILVLAVKRRLPLVVLLAMLANTLLDAVVGSVPLLGNLFDLFWKAHQKNLLLLEEPGSLATVLREAWWKLAGLIAVVLLLSILAVYLVVILVWWYQKWLGGLALLGALE